jgi:hypothetical protein
MSGCAGGAIVGTFALSSPERRAPGQSHRTLLGIGASIIHRHRARRRQLGPPLVNEARRNRELTVAAPTRTLAAE